MSRSRFLANVPRTGFHENEDVTSKDDKAYMDMPKNLTVGRNDAAQFLMGY